MSKHHPRSLLRNIIFQYHEACYIIDKILGSGPLIEIFCFAFDIKSSIQACKLYCNTLRTININGGSLAFVNNSHHWLVIKRCLTMFDYKSYICMARLVPERSSERDKKTPDLVSAIQAAISRFLYTSSV